MNGHACLLPQGQASVVALACVGDLLLQNKEHAELLQSYDERRDAAVKFIQAVRPELRVQTAPLRDPQVYATCCLVPVYLPLLPLTTPHVRYLSLSILDTAQCLHLLVAASARPSISGAAHS